MSSTFSLRTPRPTNRTCQTDEKRLFSALIEELTDD